MLLNDLNDPKQVPPNAKITLASNPEEPYDVRELALCIQKQGWIHPVLNTPYTRAEREAILRTLAGATPFPDKKLRLGEQDRQVLEQETSQPHVTNILRELLDAFIQEPGDAKALPRLYHGRASQASEAKKRHYRLADAITFQFGDKSWDLPTLLEKTVQGALTHEQVVEVLIGLAAASAAMGI